MQNLTLPKLFSLEECPFSELFDACVYPWEAIGLIDLFFKNFSDYKIDPSFVESDIFLVNREKIYIGKNVVIKPGAYIEGPVFIGDGSVIGPSAYIRPGSLIGCKVTIGHSSEVKHSIVLNGAKLPHFNYVGDSFIGCNVNLGAGVKCANMRIDQQTVFIQDGKNRFDTKMKKLGAIIGDGAQLGCNCVSNPGAIVGKGALIAALCSISGYVAPGEFLKRDRL